MKNKVILQIAFGEFKGMPRKVSGIKVPLLPIRLPMIKRRAITCDIFIKGTNEYPLSLFPLTHAITYCNPRDRVNETLGRKIAFTRALQILSPDSKPFRKYIWNVVNQSYEDFTKKGGETEAGNNRFSFSIDVPRKILPKFIKNL